MRVLLWLRHRTRPDDWWGGAALILLVAAVAVLIWTMDRPGNELPHPAVTIGTFTGPAAIAIAVSSTGIVVSRRAGIRPWLSPVALRLALGYIVLCGVGVVAYVALMLQGLDALSKF
ncbi:hypothetical protein ACFYTF_24575 [Nocardia thailandica]|uniref:Uncharacterized protein n=1 Tax=Nocardia thailandica TaxID=257275 RepID=A0ABW6PUP6_9NOCA